MTKQASLSSSIVQGGGKRRVAMTISGDHTELGGVMKHLTFGLSDTS
jgi:hypothetical protein